MCLIDELVKRYRGQTAVDRLTLEVPEELPSLPVDPYSGKPFGYVHESPTAQSRLLSSAHNLDYPIRPARSVLDQDLKAPRR